MDRLPFGIRQLDTTIGGGAPPGSVVLLSGEPGAGAREFIYTSAVMNGLSTSDPELFELYYGAELHEGPEVHYVSFTAEEQQVTREISLTMDEEVVEAGLDDVTFHDLSPEYFRLSPVPREWYAGRAATIDDLGTTRNRQSVAEALGDVLTSHAADNLVVIDSLTDLITASEEQIAWRDITVLMKGLSQAAYQWGGLILAHVNKEALEETKHGQLADAADGTLLFEWESGGSSRVRTMVVKQFRGVLSRLEEDDVVRFETEIGDAGFDVSDVRKIR